MKLKIIWIAGLLILLMAQQGMAITIENTALGWVSLINTTSSELSSLPSSMFLSSTTSGVTNIINESLELNNGKIWYNLTKPGTGNMFVGQLYPAGHTKYRLNLSVWISGGTSTPDASFLFGKLISVDFLRVNATHTKVALYYYNGTTLKTDKNYTVSGGYADTYIEYYPNGTAYIWDTRDSATMLSGVYNISWTYPYNYIAPTMAQIALNPDGIANGANVSLKIYNFEQSIPKKLVTILPSNNTFPIGFDIRKNSSYGIDWLQQNSQKATLWIDRGIYYNNQAAGLNDTGRAEIQDFINNKSFELGIHFTVSLITNTTPNATMDSEVSNISTTFGGKMPMSWGSLQNQDNSSHADYMYQTYNSYWRNAPNSILAFSNIGNMLDTGTFFWNTASNHSTYTPTFIHSVIPISETETYSITIANFTNIITNYINSSIIIMPYTKWYIENELTVTDITNIYLSPSNSYFNINTTGYNATTVIYDPNGIGNEFWYSNGGRVQTAISSSNITNLTINTPTELTVHKANGTILTDYNNNILVVVNTWNTTDDYYKKFNATGSVSSNFTIGDLAPSTSYNILINGSTWSTNTSNSTGYLPAFNYTLAGETLFEVSPVTQSVTRITGWATIRNSTGIDLTGLIIVAFLVIIVLLIVMGIDLSELAATEIITGAITIIIILFLISILLGSLAMQF